MLGTNTQALTYNLDDFSQQDSISHILLQVLDQSLVPRLCQVVIGPVRVNLLGTDKPRLLLTLEMRTQRAVGWVHSLTPLPTALKLRALSMDSVIQQPAITALPVSQGR